MLRNFIRIVVSLALVIVLAAFYSLFTVDLNDYKKEIETAVLDATGRQLNLEGDIELIWSPIPTLSVEKAKFENAKWGTSPTMVSLERFEIHLALYPLFEREIQVTKVLLKQPVIHIETNESGEGNWVFKQDTKVEDSEESKGAPVIIVNEFDIEQATIHYSDGVTGETNNVVIDSFSVDVSNLRDPFSVLLDAVVDEVPLSLSGQLGGINSLIANKASQIDLALNVGEVALSVEGDIAKPHTGKGLKADINLESTDASLIELLKTDLPQFGDLALTGYVETDIESERVSLDLATTIEGLVLLVKGEVDEPKLAQGLALNFDLKTDSSTLSTLANSELPILGNVEFTGELTGGDKAFAVEGLGLKVGDSDISGNLSISLENEKPVIQADLESQFIDLTTLASNEEKTTEESQTKKPERLFSDDPIVLTGLRQLDADVSFKAAQVKSTGLDMQDLAVSINLSQGHLKIEPINVGLAGSKLVGNIDLNAQDDLAILDGQVQVNGFKLSKVAALSQSMSGGNTDVFVKIKGRGTSVSQLMAGLNGKAIVKVAESQIADGSLDLLGADFLAELADMLNPFSKDEKGTELTCAVVNFDIKDGIATANKGIAIQTGRLNIIGDGTINLKNEKINISIKPEPRTGIGVNMSQLASLVKVGGTLANPGAKIDAAGVVTAGVSGAAAVATGGLSVVAKGLVDRTTADTNPCETALGLKAKSAK